MRDRPMWRAIHKSRLRRAIVARRHWALQQKKFAASTRGGRQAVSICRLSKDKELKT
jgi:hypothetical protein